MAKNNYLRATFKNRANTDTLISLLSSLHRQHLSAQSISNSLWGLGKLAECGLLDKGSIDGILTQKIDAILDRLLQLTFNATELRMTLMGLGDLASSDKSTLILTVNLLVKFSIRFAHNSEQCRQLIIDGIQYLSANVRNSAVNIEQIATIIRPVHITELDSTWRGCLLENLGKILQGISLNAEKTPLFLYDLCLESLNKLNTKEECVALNMVLPLLDIKKLSDSQREKLLTAHQACESNVVKYFPGVYLSLRIADTVAQTSNNNRPDFFHKAPAAAASNGGSRLSLYSGSSCDAGRSVKPSN